jgi:hypothetical protein
LIQVISCSGERTVGGSRRHVRAARELDVVGEEDAGRIDGGPVIVDVAGLRMLEDSGTALFK